MAKEFPEDNTHADHRYIRTTVYDNRVALGEAYIQALATAILVGDHGTNRFGIDTLVFSSSNQF